MQREGFIPAGPEMEPVRVEDARRFDTGNRGGPPRNLGELRYAMFGGLTPQEAEQRDTDRRQRIRNGEASFEDMMDEYGDLMVPGTVATRFKYTRRVASAVPRVARAVASSVRDVEKLSAFAKKLGSTALDKSAAVLDMPGAIVFAGGKAAQWLMRHPKLLTGLGIVGGTGYLTSRSHSRTIQAKAAYDAEADEARRQTQSSNAEKLLASLYAVADDDARMAALYGEDGRGMPQRLITHLRSLSDTMRGLRVMSADASGDRTRSDAEAYREAVGRLTASPVYGPAFKSALDDVVKSVAPELHPDNIEAAFGDHQRAMEAEYRQRLEAQKQEGR